MAELHEGAIPVQPVPGESESNGVTESGVRLFKGLLRVHLASLMRKAEVIFPSEHPVTAWLVEHVSDVLRKYLVGADGHTAYERLFGKQAREEGLEFGEQVLLRKRRAQDMNVDGRWESGIWLGRRWGSGTHRVHAHRKVVDVRAVQRRPAPERWAAAELAAVRATPWRTDPGPATEGEEPVVLQPLPRPDGAAVPAARPDLEYQGGFTSARRIWSSTATLPVAGAAASCMRAARALASLTTKSAGRASSKPCGRLAEAEGRVRAGAALVAPAAAQQNQRIAFAGRSSRAPACTGAIAKRSWQARPAGPCTVAATRGAAGGAGSGRGGPRGRRDPVGREGVAGLGPATAGAAGIESVKRRGGAQGTVQFGWRSP